MTAPISRHPLGLAPGTPIITNDRYPVVYPRSPRERSGIVVAATGKRDYVRVCWAGQRHSQEIHISLIAAIQEAVERPCEPF